MQFKDIIERDDIYSKYIIKGRKGVRVFKEKRPNHVEGMIRVTEEGELPLIEMDYLVIQIPDKIKIEELDYDWYDGVQVNHLGNGIEISMHHPQVYTRPLLYQLRRMGFIKITCKEHIRGEGSYYVNARGWQLLYNFFSMILNGIRKHIQKILCPLHNN